MCASPFRGLDPLDPFYDTPCRLGEQRLSPNLQVESLNLRPRLHPSDPCLQEYVSNVHYYNRKNRDSSNIPYKCILTTEASTTLFTRELSNSSVNLFPHVSKSQKISQRTLSDTYTIDMPSKISFPAQGLPTVFARE